MTNSPRAIDEIDVVVPVYNGARYLSEAVRSVVGQTLSPRRVIIADDGSDDDTPRVAARLAEEFANVIHLRLPHRGVSAARNAGIRASIAPLLAFLDADDLWLPNKLEVQKRVLVAGGEDVGFVHSSYFYIDETGVRIETIPVVPPARRGDILLPLLFDCYVLSGSASSVMVKREVLDHAGLFDERLFHGEDWDLWIRLAAITHVDFTPDPLVAIRVHHSSAQRSENGNRAVAYFKQHLLIFSKWPQHVAARRDFTGLLRKRATLILLPHLFRPAKIEEFYRSLESSDETFAQALFKSRLDLWGAMAGILARYVVWRIRKVFLNDRRPFC